MEPFVSIVVPAYNAERFIRRLLGSLAAQDYAEERREIIVVDNNSTDRTQSLAGSYPSVKLLVESEVRSSAAARNRGIAEASGEIIALIDADIWASPCWLRSGVECLVANNADRVAGRVEFVFSEKPNIYELFDGAINFRQTKYVGRGWSGTGNLFVTKKLIEEIGPLDAELISGQDYEFGVRATRLGKALVYCPEALVYHETRKSLRSLIKKNVRTGIGIGQLYKRHRLFPTSLWYQKANYRPILRNWEHLPEPYRSSPRVRLQMDMIGYITRMAGNYGNFLGVTGIRPKRHLETKNGNKPRRSRRKEART